MILQDDDIAYIERIDSPKAEFSLMNTMRVERGSVDDWNELHELHYKSEALPAGPRFWRCVTEDDELVGIVVTGSVSLMLAARHRMFPKLKPGNDTHLTNIHRGKWLNKNIRRAARIVTDTLYRGTGISYRMLNLACRMEGYRFTEIQSSMSKFNPFDRKAGFVHGQIHNSKLYELGMAFFKTHFDCHPADHEMVMQELNKMTSAVRKYTEREIRGFYYKNSAKEKTGSNLNVGTSKVDKMAISVVLKELQQLVFASPVYGVYSNPDFGNDIPKSLPLSAFDTQKPNCPLKPKE